MITQKVESVVIMMVKEATAQTVEDEHVSERGTKSQKWPN
jgi:hypothetical protein